MKRSPDILHCRAIEAFAICSVVLTSLNAWALPLQCGPSMAGIAASVVNEAGVFFLADQGADAIVRVDPSTGARSIVASGGVGATSLDGMTGLDLEPDGRLLVSAGSALLIRVDPVTGERSPLPVTGVTIGYIEHLTVLADGSIYISDATVPAIIRIDANTGAGIVVSGGGVGSGPALQTPDMIATDSSGRLIVADFYSDAVIRIDPLTGAREVITSDSVGSGPAIVNLQGLLVRPNDDIIIISSHLGAAVLVDPITGDRSVLADLSSFIEHSVVFGDIVQEQNGLLDVGFSDNAALTGYSGIVRVDLNSNTANALVTGSDLGSIVSLNEDVAFATNPGLNSVVKINTATGQQTIISDESNGSGPLWTAPVAMGLEPTGTLVLVDRALQTVFRLAKDTGDRSIVSAPGTHPGPVLISATSVAIAANGDIFVGGQSQTEPLYRVDAITGARTVISDPATGSGAPHPPLSSLAIEDAGHVVATTQTRLVMRINTLTGERQIVSGLGVGSGPSWASPSGIIVASDGTLYVKAASLFAVDPLTGDRSIIFWEPAPLASPAPFGKINWAPDGRIYSVGHSDFMAIYDPVAATRQVVGDADSDLIADACDNCLLAPNANQRDANGDGFGNVCDADLSDNCFVNFPDLDLLKNAFFSSDPVADFNVDGQVEFLDLAIMRSAFFVPPGPSALAVCSAVPRRGQ